MNMTWKVYSYIYDSKVERLFSPIESMSYYETMFVWFAREFHHEHELRQRLNMNLNIILVSIEWIWIWGESLYASLSVKFYIFQHDKNMNYLMTS